MSGDSGEDRPFVLVDEESSGSESGLDGTPRERSNGILSPRSVSEALGHLGQVVQSVVTHEVIEGPTVDVPSTPRGAPPKWYHVSLKKLWAFTGPGFLMSIAYLDPGNLEGDLQAGAVGGYGLLWVLFWATMLGLVLQLLAARLGVVTGQNLAQMCRQHYPIVPRYTLWLMTEAAIIGSDIQEVVGSAIAINILTFGKIPLWGGVLITAFDTFTFLFLENYGVRKLEALFCALISVMALTFGICFFISRPDPAALVTGLVVPYMTTRAVTQATAMLGAVIMPHNIYLHSALVQSRKIARDDHVEVREANKYYAIESAIALLVSFLINMCVVCVFAEGFYGRPDAGTIGLHNAGNRLQEEYGDPVLYIWAVGLLAAGQSSTMTGTYAGQFVMQGFLNLSIAPWKRVLLTRTVAIIPAISVAVLAQDALDTLDEWLNVLQSVQLPFALLPVLQLTSTSKYMGRFANHMIVNVLVWGIAAIVIAVNIFQVIVTLSLSTSNPLWYVLASVLGVAYFAFVGYLILEPLITKYLPSEKQLCCRTLEQSLSDEGDGRNAMFELEELYENRGKQDI